jgi:capsule biosynthesis phosphatase
MRICIDIDGTICPLRQPEQSYGELRPFEGAVGKINSLRKKGHYIILCTARHIKSCDSNIGKVVARQGGNLIQWLAEHEFEYDELWFGKPYAHFYLDDKAFKFSGSWEEIDEPLIQSYL